MKRVFLILLLLVLGISCNNDNTIEPESISPTHENPESIDKEENRESPSNIGLINVSLKLSLPEDAIISEDDLLISSLFNENVPVLNGQGIVDVLDGDEYEMTFAQDSMGNITLLNYFFSGNTNRADLNAETTAISMIMMLPWTSDLSVNAKQEFIEILTAAPLFQNLVLTIEDSLRQGTNTLENDMVIEARNTLVEEIFKEFTDISSNAKFEYDQEPLSVSAEENTILLKNYKSSMAYGVTMNGGQTQILNGVDYKFLSIDNFKEFISSEGSNFFKNTELPFNVTSDGINAIVTGTGLSINSTNAGTYVRSHNAGKLMVGILSAISGGLGKILSNDKCYSQLGNFIINRGINVTALALTNSNKEILQAFIDLLSQTVKDLLVVIEGCVGNFYLKSDKFQISLKTINKFLLGADNIQTGLLVLDWLKYPSQINFCIEKKDGIYDFCNPLKTPIFINFGKIPTGLAGLTTFEIENTSKSDLTIKDVILPPQTVTIPVLKDFTLNAEQKLTVSISHEEKNSLFLGSFNNYETENKQIEIITDDQDETSYKILLLGEYLKALNFRNTLGEDISGVNFGSVVKNTVIDTIVKLYNDSDYSIALEAFNFEDSFSSTPFSFKWDPFTIEPNENFDVKIEYRPTLAGGSASGVLNDGPVLYSNGLEELQIALLGEGLDTPIKPSFITHDFQNVPINSSNSITLTLENVSDQYVSLQVESNSNAFVVESQYLDFNKKETKNIIINFNPSTLGLFNGIITLKPNIGDEIQVLFTGNTGGPITYTLVPISDIKQTVIANSEVPLEVKVLDQYGNPAQGIAVSWDFLEGMETSQVSNIELKSTLNSVSDSQGIARINWPIGFWLRENQDSYTRTYYSQAYLAEAEQDESRIEFCSYMALISLRVIGGNIWGEGGFPINGSVTLELGNYSHTWTIVNNQVSSEIPDSDPNRIYNDYSTYLTFPDEQNFDIQGRVTVNLNRSANVTLTPATSWGSCGSLVSLYGFTNKEYRSSGEPINDSFDVRAIRN